MLEYWWMKSNETNYNDSDMAIEEMLQDPAMVILFVGYPRWLLNFAAACCILFMLIGIPGNFITVLALFRTKKLKNATAVFIMNLSVSDAMFCCFNLPLAASTFWHSSWLHGPLLCRLFPLLRYGLVAVSLFSILAITINRYIMIGHPAFYPILFKRKYLIPMVLAIWLVAFGLLIITWFEQWGRFGLDPIIGSCSILPDVNGRSPKEFLFVLAFLAPCFVIIVCYARIFYIVRKTALKSRGRNKIVNVEVTEVSDEQQSTRNQEDELSMLESSNYSAPSLPMQTVLTAPDVDENSKSVSTDETSSCTRQSVCDSQKMDHPTRSQLNEPRVDSTIRLDLNSTGSYDNSTTTIVGDIPSFEDDREESDFKETKLFLCKNQKQKQQQKSSLRDPCKQLGRMTSRASFVVESSFWTRRITSDNHLDWPKICVDAGSHSFRRPSMRTAFRRESKFKSIGRSRNVESVPRMSSKDKKLLQMILVIFSSFLVCYLPITITKIFRDSVDWRGLNIAGYILIYLTTCINPVIYVVMSSEYRSAYKYVLLCKDEQMTGRRKSPGFLATR